MTAYPAMVDGVPHDSGGQLLKAHMEWDSAEGCPIGHDPRKVTVAELRAWGHGAQPLLKVIRAKCIDWMCGECHRGAALRRH